MPLPVELAREPKLLLRLGVRGRLLPDAAAHARVGALLAGEHAVHNDMVTPQFQHGGQEKHVARIAQLAEDCLYGVVPLAVELAREPKLLLRVGVR